MRTRTLTALVAGIAGITLMLSGCASEPGSAEGTWGTGAEGKPQLVLEEGGALSGTDGCNRLTGGWEQNDETVMFTGVASTMMHCEGVDTWLSKLESAVIDGATLRVSNIDGSEIGLLIRQ